MDRSLSFPTFARRAAVPGLIGLTVAALILGSGCTEIPTLADLADGDQTLLLLTGSRSASEGFLTLDPQESTGDSVALGPASLSLQPTLDGFDGAGSSVTLRMARPLEKDRYLNLSKSISGALFWRSSLSASGTSVNGGTETEHVRLRAELFLGTKRIGGAEFPYITVYYDRLTEWAPLQLQFRPEVQTLTAGETLSLVVTRYGGLGGFEVGTGGDHRSSFEIHHFNNDPLAGVVEIVDGKLSVSAAGDVAPEPDAAVVGGGLALAVAGLAASRRRGTLLLAALLLTVGLAGCAGPKRPLATTSTGTEDAGRPPVETKVQQDEELRQRGVGGVRGTVRNYDNDAAIPNANVFLIGVSTTARTDRYGRYDLGDVPAGTFLMRADKDTYQSKEIPDVKVGVGEVTIVNIFLQHPPGYGEDAHTHNDYLDAKQLDIWRGSFPMAGSNAYLTQVDGERSVCVTGMYTCSAPILLPPNKYIPAGTGLVEIELDWEPGTEGPKEIGLEIQTATNKTFAQFVPRGPRDPFRIAIFPDEADPGHAKTTYWTFAAFVRTGQPTNTYRAFHGDLLALPAKVDIHIVTHKSVIPLEARHEDFWGTATEKVVVNKKALSVTTHTNKMPSTSQSWTPDTKAFVPPATAILKGKLTFTQKPGGVAVEDPIIRWAMQYRPANVPPQLWETNLKPAAETGRGSGYYEFTITPSELETDQFYQRTTNWEFFLDDQQDLEYHVGGWYTTFELTITAYKKA